MSSVTCSSPETIERFLHSSYDHFADRATVTKFLPLLAERLWPATPQALAKIEGLHHDGNPPCCSCTPTTQADPRSPSASSPLLAGDEAVGWSAGSEPGRQVNLLGGAGDGRTRHRHLRGVPQTVDGRTVRAADVVISMGCGDACPIFPGKRYELWEFDDPAGLDTPDVRPIRDEIERHVRQLLDGLNLTDASRQPLAASTG